MAQAMIHITDDQTDEILDFIPQDHFWNDERVRELVNNRDTFDFETFADETYSEALSERNRIIIPDRNGTTFSEFIIEEARDILDNGMHFTTTYTSASYLELRKLKQIPAQTVNAESPEEHVVFALGGTEWEVGKVDYGLAHTTVLTEYMDAYAYLLNIASWSGMELVFRVEHNGYRVTGRYVDLLRRAGTWRGHEAVFGVDLLGVERVRKFGDIITALIGLGPDNNDGTAREEVYIESEEALKRWGRKGNHLIETFTIESEDQNINPQKLFDMTQEELNRRISHQSEYIATLHTLAETLDVDPEDLQFGDIIRVKDEGFNPPLYLEARIHTLKESIKDYGDSEATLGDFTEFTEDEVKSILKRMREQIADKIGNAELVEAIANLDFSETVTQPTPPTDTAVLWIDNSNRPYITKIYVDAVSGWVPIMPSTAEEIGADPAGSAADALTLAREDILEVTDSLDGLRNEYDAFMADGFISRSEAMSIERHLASLNAEKADIDADYTATYSNAKLPAAQKTALNSAKTSYNSAHTSLVNVINASIADGYVTPAEITDVDNAFIAYATALGNYSEARANASQALSAKEAADAKAEAISAAASDAQTKATAAKDAAIAAANAKAEAEREVAKSYADGIVDDEEAARIAAAQAAATAAQQYADTAADDALVASKTYADTAAGNAEAAAKTHADAKAEAERVIAEAYADGVVDDEEDARIADVNAKLAAAKTYADTKKAEAIAASKTYADTAASNAQAAAITAANTKAEAEREIAKSYADGIVDDEEDARNIAINNAAIAAADDAQAKADAAATAAQEYADLQLDNLEISDRNLLIGSNSAGGWGNYTRASVSETLGNDGVRAFRVDREIIGIYGTSQATVFRKMALEVGETYTVSFEVRGTVGQPFNYTYLMNLPSPNESVGYAGAITSETEFTGITKTFTKTHDAEFCYLMISINQDGALGDWFEIRNVKLQSGSKATPWTPAPEDLTAEAERLAGLAESAAIAHADAIKLALDGDIATLNTALGNFEDTVNTTFKDGIIAEAEAAAIEKYKNSINSEKVDLDNRYTKIYADAKLSGTPKTNLLAAKNAYNTAHTNLINSVNAAIADGKTTSTEKADVDAKFTSYRTALGTLVARLEEAVTALTSAKDAQSVEDAGLIAADLASAAQAAADDYAKLLTETAEEEAKIFADGLVTTEESKRLEESGELLKAAKEHADATAKAAVEAIDNSDLATKEELEDEAQRLRDQLTERGASNIIRNSVGYGNMENWQYSTLDTSVETIMSESLYSMGFGAGFFFPPGGTSKGIKQEVYLETGKVHTLSWYISKAAGSTFTIDVLQGSTILASTADISPVAASFTRSYLTFTPSASNVTVRFTAATTTEATLSGIMLSVGNLPTQWSLATGELYNKYVRTDENGLLVLGLDADGLIESKTVMSPEEFAGYYDENRDGEFERVFWLNRDETVTKKLRALEEITMGTMKIVRIDSPNSRGWAFSAVVEDA